MKIGDRIKTSRKRKGMRQSDLADKAGVSRVTIGFYERNETVPSADIAGRIAAALGVDANYLLYGDISPFMPENTLNHPDTMSPEEIAASQARLDASIKNHIKLSEEREGFMAAYDVLNDRGLGKIHGYMYDLVEQPKYLKPGYKPLVRDEEDNNAEEESPER